MNIDINAKFPIEFGRKYYAISYKWTKFHVPCVCCDSTGNVEIKGTTYDCPRCHGSGKEYIGQSREAYVVEIELDSVSVSKKGNIILNFNKEAKSTAESVWIRIKDSQFESMEGTTFGERKANVFADYNEALEEAKRINLEVAL